MARYNKIYAGPVTEVTPQVQEAPAAAAITPGQLVVLSSGEFAVAAADSAGAVFVAQDNYLVGGGPDDAYDEGDTVIGMELLDEQFFNVRVANGQNVTRGAALALGASGALVLAGDEARVLAFAEEAYNNTSGSAQLVRVRAAKGYLTPASAG